MQINFTNKVNNHTSTSNYNKSVSDFSNSFMIKLRLISGVRIIKQLHVLLRKCYKESFFNFEYTNQTDRPSSDLHYPIFNAISRIIT